MTLRARGDRGCGATGRALQPREVHLLQTQKSKVGDKLGKTTGWIHRTGLKNKGMMMPGCTYEKIDDQGLSSGCGRKKMTSEVDNIVICAGQEPLRELVEGLRKPYHLIGGADVASELDAKRAIDQGVRLALVCNPPKTTPNPPVQPGWSSGVTFCRCIECC